MSQLYIVMLAVNCLDLTKAAYESIKTELPHTFILIDNASEDGTKEWGESMDINNQSYIPSYHPNKFLYVRNEPGKGVAESWNQGIKIALEDPECKYIAVLNNDILLHKKTLDHMVKFMDKTGYLMVTGDNVQSRMSPDVMQQMEMAEPFTDFDLWKIEGWRAEGPDFSCFMIQPDTIRVIGWFDENFVGAYCEDQDYHARCARARAHIAQHRDQNIEPERVHFKRLCNAPYYHFSSQTISRNPKLRSSISANHGKNASYYVQKWGGEHPWVMDGNGNIQPFGDATKNWRDW